MGRDLHKKLVKTSAFSKLFLLLYLNNSFIKNKNTTKIIEKKKEKKKKIKKKQKKKNKNKNIGNCAFFFVENEKLL